MEILQFGTDCSSSGEADHIFLSLGVIALNESVQSIQMFGLQANELDAVVQSEMLHRFFSAPIDSTAG